MLLIAMLYGWIQLVRGEKIWCLLIFFVVPAIQFLATPIFTQLGFYHYYSPMVVSFGKNERYIDLHNGTSFDYLFEMSGIRPGIHWKKRMLRHYLQALCNIAERIRKGELPDSLSIRGSSYFISPRTAAKLGFTVGSTSLLEKVNISLNYLDLLWMYSLSNGRLTFPNLTSISTVRTSGTVLVERLPQFSSLLKRLDSRASRK